MGKSVPDSNEGDLLRLIRCYSIIRFLTTFKLAFETNGTHEGASMWLLHLLINKFAATILNACIALSARSHR